MIETNLSTLKIHKLTQEQYDRELAAGNIDENALYLTPDEELDAKADWNQNDSTKPDYIKNRPFYTTDPVETVVAEGTVPAGEQYGASTIIESLTLGEIYTAIFDGITYDNLVCSEYYGLPVIGNDLFIFAIGEGNAMLIATDNSVSHTIEVIGFIPTVVPIERKYIAEYIDTFTGEKVQGKVYTVNGAEVIAGVGAEVFNDYETNIASGNYSHAEGVDNIASGMLSHAEGWSTNASGRYSHTEGQQTIASGDYSHAEGLKAEATNDAAHAEGFATNASGRYSHTEGDNAKASGRASHAEGYGTHAIADYSHAEGMNTSASSEYQHVQGKFNIADASDEYAHIVGNGTSDTARANAHTLDWSGNAWFAGDVTVGTDGERLAKVGEIPTVYDWAKSTTKPSYTASEVGAMPQQCTYLSTAVSADTITEPFVLLSISSENATLRSLLGNANFAYIQTQYYNSASGWRLQLAWSYAINPPRMAYRTEYQGVWSSWVRLYDTGNPPAYPVTSVNGMTGDVVVSGGGGGTSSYVGSTVLQGTYNSSASTDTAIKWYYTEHSNGIGELFGIPDNDVYIDCLNAWGSNSYESNLFTCSLPNGVSFSALPYVGISATNTSAWLMSEGSVVRNGVIQIYFCRPTNSSVNHSNYSVNFHIFGYVG